MDGQYEVRLGSVALLRRTSGFWRKAVHRALMRRCPVVGNLFVILTYLERW